MKKFLKEKKIQRAAKSNSYLGPLSSTILCIVYNVVLFQRLGNTSAQI